MDYTVFDVQFYRLDALSELYGIELLRHHNALDDTRACFEILRKFEEHYPQVVVPQPYVYGNAGKSACCGRGMSRMKV